MARFNNTLITGILEAQARSYFKTVSISNGLSVNGTTLIYDDAHFESDTVFYGENTFSGKVITNNTLDINGKILLSSSNYGTDSPTSTATEGELYFKIVS